MRITSDELLIVICVTYMCLVVNLDLLWSLSLGVLLSSILLCFVFSCKERLFLVDYISTSYHVLHSNVLN
jgi:hypothetical protein